MQRRMSFQPERAVAGCILGRWIGGVWIVAVIMLAPQRVWAEEPSGEAGRVASDSHNPGHDADPGRVAPTIDGLGGLLRVVTSAIGKPHTFRAGFHTEMFATSEFLVCTQNAPNGDCVAGDDHSRFSATLAASYTPMELLEFHAFFRSQANSNSRDDPGRLDDEVILALGDFGFGGKFQYPLSQAFGVGTNIELSFLNSVGGVSIDGDALGFYVGAIASFDVGAVSSVPLGIHMNLGFRLDNSNELANFDNYPLSSLQVEKFSQGIRPSRLQLKYGFDLRMRRWVGFGLTPIMELHFDIATTDADSDFDSPRFLQPAGPLQPDQIDGRLAAWTTIGVRASPVRGLNVELASDIGINSPGYGFGPPVPRWNLILGASYAYDPRPPVQVVTRETAAKAPVLPVGPQGKIRGRVVDSRTMEPVQGAVVTFPGRDLTGLSSDPDGGFLSYPFRAGRVAVMVRHPDYKPAKAMATVRRTGETSLELKLDPGAQRGAQVAGKIVDTEGAAVVASVVVSGPENKEVTADAAGAFSLQLKPGAYGVQVAAEGYLRKVKQVVVTAGATAQVDFSLSKRPKRPLARVTKRAIVIRRKVHFTVNTAELRPDSRQLLDAVIDVLLTTPNIAKVEIGGHTDNRGGRGRNLELSQSRAEAVRDYLIAGGVSEERLMAKGYGPEQPKVPNITPRQRALNRRVEFKILAQ